MKLFVCIFLLSCITAEAQSTADRVTGALSDRALAEHVAMLKTDDRIAMYSAIANTKPSDAPHYQVLLASTYVQKTRETTDYSYLDHAVSILDSVLSSDSSNYEALRLLTVTQLERHLFATAVDSSQRLIKISPADPWNWGTLGDAYIEMGEYDKAAEAYQKMIALRPDLASYNRAAHFHFLYNDVPGAIAIMKQAIEAGSSSPGAWWILGISISRAVSLAWRNNPSPMPYAPSRIIIRLMPGWAEYSRKLAMLLELLRTTVAPRKLLRFQITRPHCMTCIRRAARMLWLPGRWIFWT
jgi:tetratricopeptide (TPR) repeat protein